MPSKDEIIEQLESLILRRNQELGDARITAVNLSADNMSLNNIVDNLRAEIEEKDKQIALLNALNKPL